MYVAIVFGLLFVIQMFAIIKNCNLATSLKNDIYVLFTLLMFVVASNILWVFVFSWFRYIAVMFSVIFIYVLFAKLQKSRFIEENSKNIGMTTNQINEQQNKNS